jgi:hypothetical protein
MRKVFLLAATAVLATAATPAMAANLIVNGDFEASSSGPTDIQGWAIGPAIPNPDAIVLVKGSDYTNCCNVVAAGSSSAALANHFATFGAGQTDNLGQYLYQTVDLKPGSYTLGFDWGAIQGTQSLQVSIFDFASNAFIFDNASNLISQTGGQNLDTLFATHSISFSTKGGLLGFGFSNQNSQTFNVDGFLDNVTLSAVPEPTTWAMMILGLGFVGAGLRRQRMTVRFA